MRVIFVALCTVFLSQTMAMAQRIPSHCIALAGQYPGVQYASLGGFPELAAEDVRLHYIGHSTYLLETSGGLTVATDFTGYVGQDIIPNVVTMNRAHSSHWTEFPDPAIDHVLKGWGENGSPAEHYLELDEMIVRNVTTDIRAGIDTRVRDDNSIFVFEVGGLCIGHLGHLHHEPTDEHYALLGRMDIVMVPVDGGRTLDTATMLRVMKRVRARVVLPMHWFGDGTLQSFLAGMKEEFAIEYPDDGAVTVSLRDLPKVPTVYVLRPRPISN